MVYIPGGAYQTEVERVIVSEFCIDVNLVTMQEYVDCPDCSPAGNDEGAAGFSEYCNRDHDFRGGDPANCVDALQAEYYCDRNDKELPDEAQWEWAARGGPDANLYPWGATVPTDSDDPQRLCWIAGRSAAAWPNRPQGTCPVGSYDQAASHPYGLEDMSGNVWQWTTSSESAGNRVVRGGGWDNTSATRMTTAFRNTPIPETVVHAAVGFRCVADPLM
jgi:formylglycine-generating enzyme required for sulfatase activity